MDEEKLITMAKEGDLDAFNRLVLSYQNFVYSITFRMLYAEDTAADAAQEAFILAFRKIRTHRGGSFKAWLGRIATNVCLDELRRYKRHPEDSLEETMELSEGFDASLPGPMVEGKPGPEGALEQNELAQAIENCIRLLPDEFRAVIVLVDVQGFGYNESSTILKRSVGTIKSRLARARARMRDCLQHSRELLPDAFRLQDEVLL
ncbi:MAG: sigma-70 family RNA polymerase sigma factor [Anaerolineales bacterium]|nr:sigma-70 family RNA polymerase sigma factor [Anaerolineales bacterium]